MLAQVIASINLRCPPNCGSCSTPLKPGGQLICLWPAQEEDGSEYEEEDSEEEGMSWDELEKEAIRCAAFPLLPCFDPLKCPQELQYLCKPLLKCMQLGSLQRSQYTMLYTVRLALPSAHEDALEYLRRHRSCSRFQLGTRLHV